MSAKLLVCNNRRQDAEIIARLLGQENYQVDVSLQPLDALQKLTSACFGVLILTLHIGDTAWLDLIPVLNTLFPRLPVVVVTDDGSLETERLARRGRIFYYLLQPLEEQELKAVVRDAIKKNRN